MRFLLCLVAVALFAHLALGLTERSIFSSRSDITEHGRANVDSVLPLTFYFHHKNSNMMEQTLLDVSTPGNSKYGQHLSREEAHEMFGPLDGAEAAVKQVLHEVGISESDMHLMPYGHFLQVSAPISTWESVFSAEFSVFLLSGALGDTPFIRAKTYTLPDSLTPYVKSILDIVQMPGPQKLTKAKQHQHLANMQTSNRINENAKKLTDDSTTDFLYPGRVTPDLVAEHYGIDSMNGSTADGNWMAIFESAGQNYSPDDLAKYLQTYVSFEYTVPQVVSTNGGNSSEVCLNATMQYNCYEANLDMQLAMGICQNTPAYYMYEPMNMSSDEEADSFVDALTAFATKLMSVENTPSVASMSYGLPEYMASLSNMEAFNTAAMMAGLQGTSIFVSSGDTGAGFEQQDNAYSCAYAPNFPASSPYVTTVGATMGPENGVEEMTCQTDAGAWITSGGGFSTYFKTPSWQQPQIEAYFDNLYVNEPSYEAVSGYNKQGRAFPDVAALGHAVSIVVGDSTTMVDGTSASSPMFAAMVNLVNADLVNAGYSRLGFLNPALYNSSRHTLEAEYVSGKSILKDITVGDNHCTEGAYTVCCDQGFHTTRGWDPVTGYGAINFATFKSYFLALKSNGLTAADGTSSDSNSRKLDESTTTSTVTETVRGFATRQDVTVGDRADPSHRHEVMFHMKLKNIELLEDKLLEVSHPDSPNYGKHWTRQQISDYFSPLDGAHDALKSVLVGKGVASEDINVSTFGELVYVTAPIQIWEDVLGTKFQEFHISNWDKSSTTKVIRTHQYTLPDTLVEYVHAVHNTVQIPLAKKPDSIKQKYGVEWDISIDAASVDYTDIVPGLVTPKLFNQVYNIDSNQGFANNNNVYYQALYGGLGQNYSPDDLKYFQEQTDVTVQPNVRDYGGNNKSICASDPNSCGEANLDTQWMSAVSQETPQSFLYMNNSEDSDWMVGFVSIFLNANFSASDIYMDTTKYPVLGPRAPWVISVSYGGPEQFQATSSMDLFDVAACFLGLMGTTMMVSSGDDGSTTSGARPGGDYGSSMCNNYFPSYPASSPYVTTVGATQGPEDKYYPYGEVVCSSRSGALITSSGGFSYHYTAKDWQVGAIDHYFNALNSSMQHIQRNLPRPGYNRQGAGIPDVSVMGHNYIVSIGEKMTPVDGTSASSPSFGGMISLINANRTLSGKSLVGFINPALYTYGDKFTNDIIEGYNGCSAIGVIELTESKRVITSTRCATGFHAHEGWDPATGLGSVDFMKMRDHFHKYGNSTHADVPTAQPSFVVRRSLQDEKNTIKSPVSTPSPIPKQSSSESQYTEYARAHLRSDVTHRERASKDTLLELPFFLKIKNRHKLDGALRSVSDPQSKFYRQHWSIKRINQEFGASKQSIDKVKSFFKSNGISHRHNEGKDVFFATASVSTWETLLKAEFHVFDRKNSKGENIKAFTRAYHYTMPEAVREHVDTIYRTVQYPISVAKPKYTANPHLLPSTQSSVEPATLLARYNIASTDASGTTQGVFEAPSQRVCNSDLLKFQSRYGLGNQEIAGYFGNYDTDECGDEANLDIEYMMALAQGADTWVFYGEDFVEALLPIFYQNKPALSVSISYGEDESYVSASEFEQWNILTMKLGLFGTTVMVSAGDDGAMSTNARATNMGTYGCGYMPSYPASGPYVIAVGATMGPGYGSEEKVCQGSAGGVITSGGGFSLNYDQPWYQTDSSYMRTFRAIKLKEAWKQPQQGYKSTGRGYPDVAMMGFNYAIIASDGQNMTVSGTSASSPVFAAVVSLVNARNQRDGKETVGFLNPTLYGADPSKDLFNDIVDGNNKGTAIDGGAAKYNYFYIATQCDQGFYATDDWDPVSGLGSIKFPHLSDYLYNTSAMTNTSSTSIGTLAMLGIGAFAVDGLVLAGTMLAATGQDNSFQGVTDDDASWDGQSIPSLRTPIVGHENDDNNDDVNDDFGDDDSSSKKKSGKQFIEGKVNSFLNKNFQDKVRNFF
jgi:tripeptidyl-peptidase-1